MINVSDTYIIKKHKFWNVCPSIIQLRKYFVASLSIKILYPLVNCN